MAAVTYYVALPFDRQAEGDLMAGEAQECQSANAAIYRAQRMATVNSGAIAFSRTGDSATGEFEAAKIIERFGDVPSDHLLRDYDEKRAVSYFVTLPIGVRSLGAEIRGHEREIDALAFAQELAAYPLVVVAEDFGEGIPMRCAEAFGSEVIEGWQPDEWTNRLLSTYGGCGEISLQMRARQAALSPEVEAAQQFIGPRPKPKRYYLYVVDADQKIVESENTSCDTQAEAEGLLVDLGQRFTGVLVVDVNYESDEGPYPLHVSGYFRPGLAYELLTYGCAFEDTLTAGDRAALLDAIEKPRAPSSKLIEIFQRHARMVRSVPDQDDLQVCLRDSIK